VENSTVHVYLAGGQGTLSVSVDGEMTDISHLVSDFSLVARAGCRPDLRIGLIPDEMIVDAADVTIVRMIEESTDGERS